MRSKAPYAPGDHLHDAQKRLACEFGGAGLQCLATLIDEKPQNIVGQGREGDIALFGTIKANGDIPLYLRNIELVREAYGHVASIGCPDATGLRRMTLVSTTTFGEVAS